MIDRNLDCQRALQGITIPNSLAWSPNGRTMYFSDTPTMRIMAYDYDPESGALMTGRLFADLTGHPGRPDGSTVDADGCLWNAEVRGSRVVRYTPEGKVDRVITLPVSGVTSCAFGGPGMRTLYITTATQRLTEQELAQEPLAGGLFAVDVGVSGLAETPFKG
jgi:sugar lactone lactonase YvrE